MAHQAGQGLLQLTTDPELVKGRAKLDRRKPRKGAPLDFGKEENAAWEENLGTRRDAMCDDLRTAFSMKILPLPQHKQSFNALDGEGKFNLHFLLPNIQKLLRTMVISNVRSQVAERQSMIRTTSCTALDMKKMESLLTAPQLSFDAPEIEDDGENGGSGLEVDMPKEEGKSMREMAAEQLRRKNSATLAKNLSRMGITRGIGTKESFRKPAGPEALGSAIPRPLVRCSKKQSTSVNREDPTGGIVLSSCIAKGDGLTGKALLPMSLDLRPLVEVVGAPEAALNHNELKTKPERSSCSAVELAEASAVDGAAADAVDSLVDQAIPECPNATLQLEFGDRGTIPRCAHGDSVPDSSYCLYGVCANQSDNMTDNAVCAETDYTNSALTQYLSDISPTAMWSVDDTAPHFEISTKPPIKVGVVDDEIGPTMPFVAVRADNEISPTLPFVAAGSAGASLGGAVTSPTLPFEHAPEEKGPANIQISPTLPVAPVPQSGLPMGLEISPTMPFVVPQLSRNAGVSESFDISPTQPVLHHDQNSTPGIIETKTSATPTFPAAVTSARKRPRTALRLSEDSTSSSDDALSEADQFGHDEVETEATEGMTDADRKRWREEREWLLHRRRAACRHGKAQKRDAQALAQSEQRGNVVAEKLATTAGFLHEDKSRFSDAVADPLGSFSGTADDSAGFFESFGARHGRKRISLAALM